MSTITPKGRGAEPSPIIAAELAAFAIYRQRLLALKPINSPAKSLAYRDLLREFYPQLSSTLDEIETIL